MFVDFFYELRNMKVPVTIREYLMLLEAMEKGVCSANVDDFYYLARSALVKDERNFDRFDQAFGSFFRGLERKSAEFFDDKIPDSWLRALTQRVFSEEELENLQKLGFDELMDELQRRLAEQDKPHSGGNKWIGTGGTSPFGHSGKNPAGVRIGGEGGGGDGGGDGEVPGTEATALQSTTQRSARKARIWRIFFYSYLSSLSRAASRCLFPSTQ